MRSRCVLFGTVLVFGGAATTPAAVTESNFPPGTVRDLIAICAPDQSDPMITAAINYCHGFAQGAILVEEAHEEHRDVRKLFCLPSPPPPSGSEITKFIAWANALPSRLDQPAVDGMFIYLAEIYPCPQETTRPRRAR